MIPLAVQHLPSEEVILKSSGGRDRNQFDMKRYTQRRLTILIASVSKDSTVKYPRMVT